MTSAQLRESRPHLAKSGDQTQVEAAGPMIGTAEAVSLVRVLVESVEAVGRAPRGRFELPRWPDYDTSGGGAVLVSISKSIGQPRPEVSMGR